MSAGQIAPPPDAATGLDMFAAAWVERWLHHGGAILATPEGRVWKSIGVNASDAPGYVPPASDLPACVKDHRLWFAAHVCAFPTGGSQQHGWEVA